jgi:hypothetical protein
MKASGKGIGGKSNPNNKSVFNYTPTSLGKSSGHVNTPLKATKISAGKSSGGVNKPVTVAKRQGATQMRRGL